MQTIETKPNGNCFYNSLSIFFTGSEDYSYLFRYLTYKYLKDFEKEITKEFPNIDYFGKTISTKNYINHIKENSFFAGDLELSQCIYLFKINIAVYALSTNNNEYNFVNFYENINSQEKNPLVILEYIDNIKHYQLLTSLNHIENVKDQLNINKKNKFQIEHFNITNYAIKNSENNIDNTLSMASLKEEINKIIQKYKLKIFDKEKTYNLNEEEFELKIKQGYNYPIYPNNENGKFLLLHIRKYLLLKKNKIHKNIYPSYINNSSSNIESSKRKFRNISSRYILDDNNNLCIIRKNITSKFLNNDKNKNNNLLNENSLFQVPFTKNIIEYLKTIHSKTFHRGIDSLRKELISRKVYYFGIMKDIKTVISSCVICKLKRNKIDLSKKEKYNLIIFKRPKDRYIADLTYIPLEFTNNKSNKFYEENKKYKYILTITDHFSKLADSFLLEDKSQKSILSKIIYFFDYYGLPKEFGTDNGREFINHSVNNYLNKNNVKIINGLPYNPRSQGIVEKIHLTIRNSLLAIYLEDINEFNLETSLHKVMNNYNKSIHNVTLFSPYEVFYNSKDELFKIVYDNIQKYYQNKTKNSLFNEKEKCLMVNNFLFSNQKTKDGYIILLKNKVKKNKSFLKICCIIERYIDGGNYIIKIIGNYPIYKLKNNQKYCVSNKMLLKTDNNIWNHYLEYIKGNIQTNDYKEELNKSLNSEDSFSDEIINKENDSLNNNDFKFIDFNADSVIKRLNKSF